MITPLQNMTIGPLEVVTESDEVDVYTPDPEVYELTSENPDVYSVGDGEVVGFLDNGIVIKTKFNDFIEIPEYYKVPKLTFNEVTQEYETEWITPNSKSIERYYYITYDNMVSDLIIGNTVNKGQVIGQTIDNKLIYSVTTLNGFDIIHLLSNQYLR